MYRFKKMEEDILSTPKIRYVMPSMPFPGELIENLRVWEQTGNFFFKPTNMNISQADQRRNKRINHFMGHRPGDLSTPAVKEDYGSNWGALAPVALKFDEIDYNKIPTILHKQYQDHYDAIDHFVTLYEIRPAYLAVAAAVRWYNNKVAPLSVKGKFVWNEMKEVNFKPIPNGPFRMFTARLDPFDSPKLNFDDESKLQMSSSDHLKIIGNIFKDMQKEGSAKKEYEVLSILHKSHPTVVMHKNEDGSYGTYSADGDILLKNARFDINSIKRLSDGKVFTLGDLVVAYYPFNKPNARIHKFVVSDSPVIVTVCTEGESNFAFLHLTDIKPVSKVTYWVNLMDCPITEGGTYWYVTPYGDIQRQIANTKADLDYVMTIRERCFIFEANAKDFLSKQQIILTTKDGALIRKGDKVWRVFTRPGYYECYKPYDMGTPPKSFDGEVYFWKEQAAKDWCFLNKPVLSLQDATNLLNSGYTGTRSQIEVLKITFTNLVKSKLNGK